MLQIEAADISRDRETGRHGNGTNRHFSQAGALPAEDVGHRSIPVHDVTPEPIYPFPQTGHPRTSTKKMKCLAPVPLLGDTSCTLFASAACDNMAPSESDEVVAVLGISDYIAEDDFEGCTIDDG
jgi:hypothetical protein